MSTRDPIRREIIHRPSFPLSPHHGLSRSTRRAIDRQTEDGLRRIAHVGRDLAVNAAIVEASAFLARLSMDKVAELAEVECAHLSKTVHIERYTEAIMRNFGAMAAQAPLAPATCPRP